MMLTDLSDQIQDQVWSLVHVAQDSVIDRLAWLTEPTRNLVPDAAVRFANRLPNAAELLDRGFATTEKWVQSQREFVAKLADVLAPSA